MSRDVLISIKGLQFQGPMDVNSDSVELIVAGQYYEEDGTKILVYDEELEGIPGKVLTAIRVRPERVELSKDGAMAVSMVFEQEGRHLSSYRTPFGTLMIGIDTSKIQIDEDEDKLRIGINYHLEINYEYFAECRVDIAVCSKELGGEMFH